MKMSFAGSAGPINSILDLASALSLSEAFLQLTATAPDHENYRRVVVPAKVGGAERIVYSPSRSVRLVQRRLVSRFLKCPKTVYWPPYIFGGIPNTSLPAGDIRRDYVACAARHSRAKSLLKMDVRNFFENIHQDVVEDIFVSLLRWKIEPAALAAKLCTMQGFLPQGGISSSYLALLCLHDVEPKVATSLGRKNLTYTRYVDDITISSGSVSQDYEYARRLVEDMLLKKGLSVNYKKLVIQKIGTHPLLVHNLRVGHTEPRLPQSEVKRIKLVCKQTIMMARQHGVRTFNYRKKFNKSVGLVNKLARVKNNQHGALIKKLMAYRPMPSWRDYDIATDVGFKLREVYDKKCDTFWYWKRYNMLMDRINIIGRENEGWASTLRKYMRNHFKPLFKNND